MSQNRVVYPNAPRRGRRSKRQLAVEAAEAMIEERLPVLVEKMFTLATAHTPDFKACAYLIDRVMGKPVVKAEDESGPVEIRLNYVNQAIDGPRERAEAAAADDGAGDDTYTDEDMSNGQ